MLSLGALFSLYFCTWFMDRSAPNWSEGLLSLAAVSIDARHLRSRSFRINYPAIARNGRAHRKRRAHSVYMCALH